MVIDLIVLKFIHKVIGTRSDLKVFQKNLLNF